MTGYEMLSQFQAQMRERPEVEADFLAWYFDSILPTLPSDCVRFSDCDDWAEVEFPTYHYNPN
jgi:hypothetical protein